MQTIDFTRRDMGMIRAALVEAMEALDAGELHTRTGCAKSEFDALFEKIDAVWASIETGEASAAHNDIVLAPPSRVLIDGEEYELHHDFELESITTAPAHQTVAVRLNNKKAGLVLTIKMEGVTRSYLDCAKFDDDVNILTMIGWTHKDYPEEFRTYAMIEDPDEDWDLTLVFGETLNLKFGGGRLTARLERRQARPGGGAQDEAAG
jgi:hypothetical protein